jgi:3-methylfumaryl-CoA hydratase
MTEVVRTETLVPGPADALVGLLGIDWADRVDLPLLWHWIYLLDRAPQDDLGPDGHPFRGVVPEPAGTGMRRMFAGGAVRQSRALRLGEPATRRSWAEEPVIKQGRSGRLVFVTMRSEVSQSGEACVHEAQELVYLEARRPVPPSDAATPTKADPAVQGWQLPISPTFLFRFSALTYNAHRIHYDRDYARDVEGYAGLVVHGPLQAIAMAQAAAAASRRTVVAFDYRLTAPLLEGQGMVVAADADPDGRWRATVRDSTGRTTASAVIDVADPA